MKKTVLIMAGLICMITAGNILAANASENFEFLRKVFNKHQDHMGDYLVHEIKAFMKTYPDNEQIAEASYLLAQVYLEMNEEDKSFAQLMKTLYLYPNGGNHVTVVGDVHKIITDEKRYREKEEFISGIADGEFRDDSKSENYYNYLVFLHELDEDNLYDWTLDEMYHFIESFASNEHSEEIQRWIADTWYARGDENAAVNGYLKYEELYPKSKDLPYVMIKRAKIMNRDLKQPGDAIALLTEVIEKYPETDYAATALYDRGMIKEERNDDYEGAIQDYRSLVQMKPQNNNAVDALMEIARIREKKMKAYRSAIKVYDEVINDYPVDIRGVQALQESAELAMKLDDYLDAANRYAKIATQYPDYKEAPKMAFKAADIARGKLKDLHKAIEYLQLVVTNFPDTEASRDAQKKISDLQEKLNK